MACVHVFILSSCFDCMCGHNEWMSRSAAPSHCIACLVWADGTHSQSTSLTAPLPGEQWWPCIILDVEPTSAGLVPFYCPALAWQDARPWAVHISRVRSVGNRMHAHSDAISDCLEPIENQIALGPSRTPNKQCESAQLPMIALSEQCASPHRRRWRRSSSERLPRGGCSCTVCAARLSHSMRHHL